MRQRDPESRAVASIRRSFAVTAAFAAYKGIMGWYLRSAWLGSMAAYYLVLGMAVYMMKKGTRGIRMCKKRDA